MAEQSVASLPLPLFLFSLRPMSVPIEVFGQSSRSEQRNEAVLVLISPRAAGLIQLLGDCALPDTLRRYADTFRRDLHSELVAQV
jgi:hypothetical protein